MNLLVDFERYVCCLIRFLGYICDRLNLNILFMKKTLKTCSFAVALCCFTANSYGQNVPSYSTQAITKDLVYFNDWTASELAVGFKNKHLKMFNSPLMRELAEKIKNDQYDSRYLLNSYAPIPSNKVLEKQLKLKNGYSRYENMTGVYLDKGEHVVLVGDLHGRQVGLLIADWMRQPTPGYAPTKIVKECRRIGNVGK